MSLKRLTCVAIVAAFLASPVVFAEARAISEAEEAAVAIAAGYLSRGPTAVIDELAPQSPLRRYPAHTLPAEIEVRLGPRDGARWQLQTVVPALADRTAAFPSPIPRVSTRS